MLPMATANHIWIIIVATVAVIVIVSFVKYKLTGGRVLPRALGGQAPPEEPEKETESWKRPED